MAIVGFTGTSQGCTLDQLKFARIWLEEFIGLTDKSEFHHGDCVGADEQVARIAHSLGFSIVLHPPTNPKARAFTQAPFSRKPKPYLERNHDIVDECNILLACPKGFEEELRSGTWATVRYARKKFRPVRLVWPNGKSDLER
jgi:hypothetical protein